MENNKSKIEHKSDVIDNVFINKNKEYLCYFTPSGWPSFSLLRENGEYSYKKNFSCRICYDCGKVIGAVYGGSKKHSDSCKVEQYKWLNSQLEKLEEENEWRNLNEYQSKWMKHLLMYKSNK